MIVKFITLKWGTKYGPEYVNRLYRTLKNIYTGDFEFYCFTDNSTGLECKSIDIKSLPLYNNSVFTSVKLDLFNKLPFEGPYVFLDLDVLILKDLYQYFKDYKFTEPRFIYNYWQEPERIFKSYFTNDCFINSSFITWNGNQLQWLYNKFLNYQQILKYKFHTLDKFIFYSSRKELFFHPKKTVYAYSFGAEYYTDKEAEKYRDEYYITLFNTSHGKPKGIELHQAKGWARDRWVAYD